MLSKLEALLNKQYKMPTETEALPGRNEELSINNVHFVNGNVIKPPFDSSLECIVLALGCFWGAERRFWQQSGVYSTAVGYIAGYTPNPTYEEVCTGRTGHTEAVLVVYDPNEINFETILTVFWESHDPTQGMRQGNDAGTQYRSGIYYFNEEQKYLAERSMTEYQQKLINAGYPKITTEIKPANKFYYAEEYHQQYLAKNPNGYCGLGGTGVSCK